MFEESYTKVLWDRGSERITNNVYRQIKSDRMVNVCLYLFDFFALNSIGCRT